MSLDQPLDPLLDYGRLTELAKLRRDDFANASPYPHVVIDDFLPIGVADAVRAEFDGSASDWDHYYHYNERKLAITHLERMGPATQKLVGALQSRAFLQFLEQLTGLEDLLADPHLDGAGMHQTLPGGHLNIHTDFLAHPVQQTWNREINVILYFNRDWQEDWNGNLEMWDTRMTRAVQSVVPSFNRCVIFRTSGQSLHGHPLPLVCPSGESRKSLALYYFKDYQAPRELHPTAYHARPDDGLAKRLLIAADTVLIRLYSMLRRHAGVKDSLVSRILKYF